MKTIWILGAGASIGHTNGYFPSFDQFFKKARELHITMNKDGNRIIIFNNVSSYIRDNFGKNILDMDSSIDIEKVMTNIDIDIEKYNVPENNTVKKDILELIRIVLDKSSKNLTGNVEEYFKMAEMLNECDSIVSFNWDLLLDNILGRREILPESPGESYGECKYKHYKNMIIDMSAYGENTFKNIAVPQPYNIYDKEIGFYLKLHGSIDWLYCSNNFCRGYGKVFPILNHNIKHFCSVCHEEMKYMVIPPVLNKRYGVYPFIKNIWNKAAKEIEYADKLIIWGYSLPPTDFYSNWLLRQGRTNIKDLVIINPECVSNDKRKWNKEFINNIVRLFLPELNIENIHTYYDFKDYYDDISVEENQQIEVDYTLQDILCYDNLL